MIPSVWKCFRVTLVQKEHTFVDDVELKWTAEDPCAVTFVFSERHGNEEWIVGRELLKAGCSSTVGDGDVHIRPVPYKPWMVGVLLRYGGKEIVVQFSRPRLMQFIESTECVVPVGEELIPVDGWLSEVLGEAS